MLINHLVPCSICFFLLRVVIMEASALEAEVKPVYYVDSAGTIWNFEGECFLLELCYLGSETIGLGDPYFFSEVGGAFSLL